MRWRRAAWDGCERGQSTGSDRQALLIRPRYGMKLAMKRTAMGRKRAQRLLKDGNQRRQEDKDEEKERMD